MSDIRAKAEARRAKILARESSSSQSRSIRSSLNEELPISSGAAKEGSETGEGMETELSLLPATSVRVERPLAARKKRISEAAIALKQAVEEKEEASKEKEEEEDTGISPSSSSSLGKEAPSRRVSTIEEIELEVRQRTAEFDAKVRSSQNREGNKEEEVSLLKKKKRESKRSSSSNSSSSNSVMLWTRLILVLAMGISTGYRAIPKDPLIRSLLHAKYASSSLSSSPSSPFMPSSFSELKEEASSDDFSASSAQQKERILEAGETLRSLEETRTWSQWFSRKLRRQVETSVSAVSTVGFIMFFLKPQIQNLVNKHFYTVNKMKFLLIECIFPSFFNSLERLLQRRIF